MSKSIRGTLLLLSMMTAALLTSCAPSLSTIASDLIAEGRDDEAIAQLSRAVIIYPDEPEYKRLLGIALYNKKLYSECLVTFRQVLAVDEEDDQAAYYLAASYEALRDYDKAIQYYRLYMELTFFGEYKDLVEARIKLLYRQQIEQESQKALAMEAQLDVARIPNNTIAILYFENKGQKTELNPLQKGLAEMVITDLSKVKSLKVVERIRLQEMMQELNLGETDLVDQRTAPRLGKLLGAYRLVKGSFFELTGDNINIDAFVARTRTGELDVTTNISGHMENFFRMEKDLVFKIIADLKITLTDEERQSILEIPTENFFAFLQYSRGLDYEDRGLYTQAYQSYSQAASSDPGFSQAKSSASAAKKVEAVVGTTSESGTTSEKSTGTQSNQTQQNTSASRSGAARTVSPSVAPPPPPPNAPGGNTGTSPNSPMTGPNISSPVDQIQERAAAVNNSINSTVVPGAGSGNTPQTNLLKTLDAPPSPPK